MRARRHQGRGGRAIRARTQRLRLALPLRARGAAGNVVSRGRRLRARRLPLAPLFPTASVAHGCGEHRALAGQAVPDPLARLRHARRLDDRGRPDRAARRSWNDQRDGRAGSRTLALDVDPPGRRREPAARQPRRLAARGRLGRVCRGRHARPDRPARSGRGLAAAGRARARPARARADDDRVAPAQPRRGGRALRRVDLSRAQEPSQPGRADPAAGRRRDDVLAPGRANARPRRPTARRRRRAASASARTRGSATSRAARRYAVARPARAAPRPPGRTRPDLARRAGALRTDARRSAHALA